MAIEEEGVVEEEQRCDRHTGKKIAKTCKGVLDILGTLHVKKTDVEGVHFSVKMGRIEFFKEYNEVNRYQILEVVGKGSYGVVCSAIDTHTGEKVAIKKINDIFEHVSDTTRILREIKLLRFLKHRDIVEIKHILLQGHLCRF
ncbi:hypothetical protein L7F22_058800 [Adiantum nelumboides]|nr:hypothetical protein [Adiantum nelumboides]